MKMASATRTWAVIKKHIPLIKFRKSQINGHGHSGTAEAAKAAPAVAAPLKVSPIQTVIEDWQLARKYQRKPISAEEIGYINRGGPA